MSTITAIGPAVLVDGPLPQPPEYRLLSVPGVRQDAISRWQAGVQVWGYPEALPSLWEPCSSGTFRTKSTTTNLHSPRFDPIVAYVPIICSTIASRDLDGLAERAQAVMEASLSFAVEKALAKGVTGSNNAFFGDSNLTALAAGAAVLPQAGLNYLENAIGQSGRAGMIHATPGTVSAWNFVNLITDNGEGVIETANGTVVASEAGIYDTDPAGKTGSDPTVGQEWAFATGPVEVFVGDVSISAPGDNEAVDQATNTVTYFAEVEFVAYWDRGLQAGVLIDWTP